MSKIKVTSWNVEHLDRLTRPNLGQAAMRRREAVVQEIRELNPDILCLLEGPKGEAAINLVCEQLLGNEWVAIKALNQEYDIQGSQWIWFLVRQNLLPNCSLLSPAVWDALTQPNWSYNPWGVFEAKTHSHYRHPQVLVYEQNGFRVEFIGLHLKSKFVNEGKRMWEAGGGEREKFIREALTARIKMTTEAVNVRNYIEKRFEQTPEPAIFVLGDLNDGPGKEFFEYQYLFFDLISNMQGDVFFASRFLNHALFDYPDHLRWTVSFRDFVEPNRRPEILLDHILFTQGLVKGSLPWHIESNAGLVEHEIHDRINAILPNNSHTSDHKPVSVLVTETSNP
jgi:hypothetical protein